MKKISLLILSILLTIPTLASAQQADKKDFLFLGGNVGFTTPGGHHDDKSKIIAGVEGVYMKKVWGKFSLGAGLSYGLGLPSKEKFSSPELNGIPAHDIETSRWNNDLTLSLLAGTILENNNGSRTVIIFGPTVGQSFTKVTTKRDFLGAELTGGLESLRLNKYTDNDTYVGGRLGLYYQAAKSNWTYGVNGIYAISSNGTGGTDNYLSAKISVGYAF